MFKTTTSSQSINYYDFDIFLVIGILSIRICFVLRASDLGFNGFRHSLKPDCNNRVD
jgi:hypothetical protein